MADLVLSLDDPATRLLTIAGGKGAGLAKMRASGLPVPQGFVVTTQSFAQSGFALPSHIDDQMAATDPDSLESLESLCSSVRQTILDGGVPEEVASAVAAAYEELGDGIAVSVRSSATAEDQPWASFAGQYDTFLNVVGKEAVLDRLLKVWASLYSTRAVAYGLRLGISLRSVGMAVVVQRQLQSQAAGVLFTRDPVTGDEGHYQINAALGLGDGVVTGEMPTDAFTLNSKTWEVVSQTLARKDTMVTAAPRGGIHRAGVPLAQQEAPAMTHRHLAELGRLAHNVTRLFNDHQDIEFAVQADSIQLLQARPLTGIDEASPFPVAWEDAGDAKYSWMLGQGPAFRLQEDAIRFYSEGSRACFQKTGSPRARNHIVRFFNGYSYSRSPAVDESEVSQRHERHQARDRAYMEQGTSLYEAEIRPQVEQALVELARFRPRRASLPALVQHLERTFQAYGHVMGNLHWSMAGGMHMNWPSTYREITGEPEVASGVLLQAIPNKTMLLVRRLRNLARLVREDPDLKTVFGEHSYHRLWETPLRARLAVRRFRSRFRSLLRSYGLRTGRGFGSSASFTTPTWNIDQQQPLDLISAYSKQDLDALEKLEADGRQGRKRAERRIHRLLAGDQERLERFQQAYKQEISTVKRMENHNHIMEQGVSGALSEAIFWTGQGLVREELLDHSNDVLHISLAELKEIANGRGPSDLKTVVGERAQELQSRSRLRAPAALGSGEPPSQGDSMYDLPANVGLDGLLLRGIGASPGKATGRARVVPTGPALPQVERGDILVAQNAGPAWTPILPLLGGLVLDAGAVFQHAALVAREYGIPAVIMTRDATAVVLDGQTIGIDADQGIVELMP